MGETGHASAPWYINAICTAALSVVIFCGRIRDLFWRRPQTRKGYADLSDQREDFYNRRMYRRIHDCWNRPISSAPGAWIDVMERVDIDGRAMRVDPDVTGRTQRCLNLGSYNYLGFAAADEYCTPRVLDTLQDWGVATCSPRSEAGTCALHGELEALVADFLGKEDAITFGMGFATNAAAIPALAGPGSLVLSDALNHTSIVAGVKASGAVVKVFRHNDMAHLEKLLRWHIAEGQPRTHRPWKKVIIVVEGIYSMEGETTLLRELVEVKKKYKAYLYLDEAHSIGCMGAHGRGLCEHAGVDPADVDVLMGTFTKSFGSAGGYIAGSRTLVAYLRRHCPAHLYASSMAPGVAQQIMSAIRLLQGADGSGRGAAKIKQLHDNANYFRRRLLELGLHVLGDWDSPVMPIMVYHLCYISGISRRCLARHVAMVVVGFPATALLQSRCRVCISASHSRADLDYALDVIADVTRSMALRYDAPQLPWPWCWLALALWPRARGGAGGGGAPGAACKGAAGKGGEARASWRALGEVLLGVVGGSGAPLGKGQPLVTAAA
ncbi:long chain base biosynthesis protein 2d [Scenedesmus sp. PABB004]|nr:long chain base biosynthesis protein 2d [Scenedesmus sp. PABB004]